MNVVFNVDSSESKIRGQLVVKEYEMDVQLEGQCPNVL